MELLYRTILDVRRTIGREDMVRKHVGLKSENLDKLRLILN